MDLFRLVELARLTGHQIFPAAAGEKETGGETGDLKYKKLIRNALGREKARGYLFSGVIIFALYFAARTADIISAAYLAAGLLNLALSMYCLLSNRERDLLGPNRI
ncbi:MAG: hypothetical protein M1609_09940 [Firmicutes bacterium]|nr:hypothetical protein [Bacillota bacterium]